MPDPKDSQLPVPVPDEKAEKPTPVKGRPRKKFRADQSLRVLNVDFQKPPADQILPCSDLEQSCDLNWTVDDVRAINQSHGLYEKLPMVCKGAGCFWAKRCPTAPDFLFLGFPCPLQIIEAYTRFVELVQELEVKPDDNVDLDFIADLVRIDLQMKELDMQMAVDGQMTDIAVGVWQKTGDVRFAKGVNPAAARQSALRKDRNDIYTKLIASRLDKAKKEAVEGKKETDLLTLFAKAMEKGKALTSGAAPTIIDVTPHALSEGDDDPPEEDEDDF
jgi:hypothetical protein